MRQKRGRKIRVGSVRVTVYARHGANCPQKADSSGSVACDCIKWMQFASGKRESTNQWTWAAAEKVARERAAQLAGVADIPQVRKSELMLVDAIEKYMDWRERDCKSNDKHRLMTGKLLAYCKAQQVDYLAQVTASLLSNFKSTLNYATHLDKSNSLKIHWSIVGVFFNWCVGEGHLTMSPMPSGPQNATPSGKPDVVPFSQSKMDRIIVAVDRVNGWDYERQNRVRTLIWMMRWSGMAIRDTATLPRHKLQGTSVVGLDRSKTGVAAYPQIPEWVADALVTLPCDDSEYFFWYRGEKGQKVKDTTIVHYYEADLRKVFAAAGIEGHSHQFRHTFITEQLAAGTPIERVAEMAGNSPDEIRKTYKHWIPKMHEQLKQEAAMAWVKMGLDAKGNPSAPTACNRHPKNNPPGPRALLRRLSSIGIVRDSCDSVLSRMSEQFYTIQEIAERWRVDPEKVTRIIQNEPGVLDLGTPANIKKRKRAYRILRVPLAVLTRVERKRAK